MNECTKCIHHPVCKTAESCDGYVSGCEHFKEGWISVKDRLPEERNSIFAKYYGTERWTPLMFRKISDEVLAVVEYEDGTRKVKTIHTTDGEWRFTNLYGAKKVTDWMPLPQPPKGE